MINYRQHGLTIIEIVVTIVILGIALVGVSAMVSRGLSESATTLLETQAIALGNAYLDEISGRRFDENSAADGSDPCYGLPSDPGPPPDPCTAEGNFGPDQGENSRPRYDDVDDYHGLTEGVGYATPLQDAEGNNRDGYESFSVTVTVRYAGDDAVLGKDETDAKLIVVSVDFAGQTSGWEFSAYRGNF